MRADLLIVDDQETIVHFISRFLQEEDKYDVRTAFTGTTGLDEIDKRLPDLVILDLKLPDLNGLEVLQRIKERDKDIIVIIITAFGQIDTAVKAMRLGAYDYITKPVSLDQLLVTIEKALESKKLIIELNYHRRKLREKHKFDRLIGNSSSIKNIHRIIDQVAKSSATSIFIEGESGTGKELIANIVHHKSDRFDKPFMEINCAALPESLLESELFGHEKGAFTDARTQKKGLLELAHNGTLFLDEIGEMSPTIQAKLLRVLERMSFKRVGGVRDISVDVRVISATNRDLDKAVEEGHFREDLYYRLKVVPVSLPPLREREMDVLLLAKFFIREFNKAFNKHFKRILPETEAILLRYSWPGNVRELKNLFERVVLLEEGEEITADMLPDQVKTTVQRCNIVAQLDEILKGSITPNGILFKDIVEEIEKAIILKCLSETNWNQSETAELLNIKRDKLRYRIKLYDLRKEPS